MAGISLSHSRDVVVDGNADLQQCEVTTAMLSAQTQLNVAKLMERDVISADDPKHTAKKQPKSFTRQRNSQVSHLISAH